MPSSTVPRIALVVCLIVTIFGTALPRAAADAAPQGVQKWSLDAFIVTSANAALSEFAGFSAGRQQALSFMAIEIAKLRRTALKRLVRSDPKRALLLSLSASQRQGLPKYILNLLEQHIHAVGDLTQAVTESAEHGLNQAAASPFPSQISWTARIGKITRQAFVYGLRLRHQTKYDTPLHGIALDDAMAVDESPLYLFDEFETVQLGFLPGQIVATDGQLPFPLPDIDTYIRLRKALIDQILRFGPFLPINTYPWTTGAKRVLVIKADYGDLPGATYTDAQIAAGIADTSAFFEENSQGRTSLGATVIPVILRLPSMSTAYAAMDEGLAHERIAREASTAAREYDAMVGGARMYDPDAYDRVMVLTPQIFSRSIARGELGGKNLTITGDRLVLEALAHEFGHTYGFIHSAFWFVGYDADPIGPGDFLEYGDMWDMMGAPTLDDTAADPRRRHFNTYFKALAGWFPEGDVAHTRTGGIFRLYRHDAAGAAGLRAIRIDADDEKAYWLDMRRQFPWNTSMAMGIEVRRVKNNPRYVYGPLELLDMDTTSGTSIDHSLRRFQTFEDTAAGVNVRVANVGVDAIGDYADIVITR